MSGIGWSLRLGFAVKTRIKHSKSILHLPETVDELVAMFYEKKIIESWIRSKHEMEKRLNSLTLK
jgi:hypothetical protein